MIHTYFYDMLMDNNWFMTDEKIPAQSLYRENLSKKSRRWLRSIGYLSENKRNAKMSYVLTSTNALAKAGSREVCVSTGSHFLLRARFDRFRTDTRYSAATAGIFSDFFKYFRFLILRLRSDGRCRRWCACAASASGRTSGWWRCRSGRASAGRCGCRRRSE